VPFTGQVRLHSIVLRGSAGQECPRTLKVFVNEEGMGFDEASDKEPTQTLEIAQTSEVQEVCGRPHWVWRLIDFGADPGEARVFQYYAQFGAVF